MDPAGADGTDQRPEAGITYEVLLESEMRDMFERNVIRKLAAQDWERTIWWSCMACEYEQIPFRLPEWARLSLMGIGGGILWGLMIGLGLAGVI